MLGNILKPDECANCRICCVFDKYDIWETPMVTRELKARIEEKRSDISFAGKDGAYIFRIPESSDGLYYCPALDSQSGCILGNDKPFDCKIWPYRVMKFGGKRVITIASICPTLYKKPLSDLVEELSSSGLAKKIFDYADKTPCIVKDYQKGYPILLTE